MADRAHIRVVLPADDVAAPLAGVRAEMTAVSLVRLLQKVAMAANEASTLEEAAQTAVDEICALMDWPVGHLYVVDADGTSLVPSDVWRLGDPERFAPFRTATELAHLRKGVGLVGEVAASGKPAWYPDVTRHPSFIRTAGATAAGLRAFLALPVLAGPGVAAVLEFMSTEPVDPDEDLLEVLAQVGTQLGRVVERSRAAAVERERARLADHLRLLLQSTAEGIYSIDPDGRFTFVNRAACELLGWSPEELMGRDAHAAIHHSRADGSPYPPHECPNLQTVRLGDGSHVESDVMWRRSGTSLPVSYSSFPIQAGDTVEGAVVIFTDTSERQRAERALRRLAMVEDREHIAKDLHDGVIQSLFAVGMGLSAAAAICDDEDVSQRISAAVEDLDGIMAEVRSFVFSRRARPLAQHDLGDGLRQLAGELEERGGVAGVADVDEALAAELEAKGDELLMVAREAVSNVARHAAATTCAIRLRRHGSGAVLEVEDDGKGFTPEGLQGTGMGLVNLRERAGSLNGTLEIDTAPGRGTTVRVAVPLVETDEVAR